jgi:hypothetical protein
MVYATQKSGKSSAMTWNSASILCAEDEKSMMYQTAQCHISVTTARTSDLLTVFQEICMSFRGDFADDILNIHFELYASWIDWCTCYFIPQESLGMLNPGILATASFKMFLCPTNYFSISIFGLVL